MDQRQRFAVAGLGAVCLFALVQIGALALVEPFKAAGFQAVEDPQDPTNSVFYVLLLLVATGAMLLVIRYDVRWLLRGFLVVTSALISWYVFAVVAVPVADLLPVSASLLAASGAVALGAALYLYPEWYVIDAAGLVMGIGAAALFGISFGVLPAIVLLGTLAVYDAIAVYRTEHMLTLASGVMDLRVPVVLVFPLRLDYSFLDATATDETPAAGASDDDGGAESGGEGEAAAEDRDAFFIGLGDAVMPSIMVASGAFFLDTPALVDGIALTLPALTSMAGTLAGLTVLLWLVSRGRAHAGLPLLNGGAILGYLAGALAAGVPLATALGLEQAL